MSGNVNPDDTGNDSLQPDDEDISTETGEADLTEDTGETVEDEAEGEALEDETSEQDEEEKAEDEGEAKPEPKADEAVAFELTDGTKVTVAEARSGYMRDADYRHKTMALAENRKSLEASISQVTNVANALAEVLASSIPEAPSHDLAFSDPAKYQQMKILHDLAQERVRGILAAAEEVKPAKAVLDNQQREDLIAAENEKLLMAEPKLTDRAERQKFFDAAFKSAQALGFSRDEIANNLDHRMFRLAHYAEIGMRAVENRAKAQAQATKVAKPAAPAKPGGSQAAITSGARQATQLVNRARQTGSIDDVLAARLARLRAS